MSKMESKKLKNHLLNEIWSFCETEFNADFENDYIIGIGSNSGMSDRTEAFVDRLVELINDKVN